MITFSSTFPVFVSADIEILASYYQATFGFEAVFLDPSFYLHLKHPLNGTEIGFLVPDHPSQPAMLHAAANHEGYVLSFEVADARTAFAAAEALELDIAMPFREEPWGQRHFMVRDPGGLVLDIVEHFDPAG